MRVGLLSKPRGNFAIQRRFAGSEQVHDTTGEEVEHHRRSLEEAGYAVQIIPWDAEIIRTLAGRPVDLVFNVSSMVEAALLEELELPYVGSDPCAIAVATDKSLAKRLWQQAGLPTSPFAVVRSTEDCLRFRDDPPFAYPVFIKPVAGRGSAGVDSDSVVEDYEALLAGVERRLHTIRQPVLVERYLSGREITLGVIGNAANARVLPPLEIRYREGDRTLTYDKKERDDDAFLCPAPLDGPELAEMQELALRAYRSLGLRDFGRIDTILSMEGPFLLEANTFAGLTTTPPEHPHSYVGFMARAEGHGGAELLHEIVQAAVERLGLNGEQL